MTSRIFICFMAAVMAACGCQRNPCRPDTGTDDAPALYFRIAEFPDGSSAIVTIDPVSAETDTFRVAAPCRRIVCMSSGYVACLSALGEIDAVCAVSGTDYISDTSARRRIESGDIAEAGYDSAPDYEKILSLSPDVVVAYALHSSGNAFVKCLRQFGIPVLVLHDYLEHSPLARAEYVKVFGALTGHRYEADSIYDCVSRRYNEIADAVSDAVKVSGKGSEERKVLMNIPYSDAWYIPGEENYMSRLIRDAGGRVLGAEPGRSESSVISVERAFALAKEADVWLNPGWCDTKSELYDEAPVFRKFNINEIYNNTLKRNPKGGNDFWESGAVRPDLILNDLANILHPEAGLVDRELHYYKKVE
ncbi:MAG: ABC transporter substrate-binding protein [Candidatus Cryptobacteroides sp.]